MRVIRLHLAIIGKPHVRGDEPAIASFAKTAGT